MGLLFSRKAVRMRFILLTLLFGVFAHANTGDISNGNLISEPNLSDYSHATRTPGFSEVYDIVDQNGASVQN